MARVRNNMRGELPIILPDDKTSRREVAHHRPGPNWGWMAWLAIALTATGLLAWRVLDLMRP